MLFFNPVNTTAWFGAVTAGSGIGSETQRVTGAAYVAVVTSANNFAVSSTGLWDTIAQTNFSNTVYAAFLPVASTNAYGSTQFIAATYLPLSSTGAYGATQFIAATYLDLPSTNAYGSTQFNMATFLVAETQTVSGSTHVGVITNVADFQVVSLDSNIVDFAITNAYSLGSSGTVGQVSRVDDHNLGILFPTSRS